MAWNVIVQSTVGIGFVPPIYSVFILDFLFIFLLYVLNYNYSYNVNKRNYSNQIILFQNHPELNISGISLDDIKQRVALVNGAKKLMFGGQKSDTPVQKMKRGPKKEPGQKASKTDSKGGGKKKEEQSDSVENKPLLPNIKIKCEQEESDSEHSSFVDPMASPKHKKLFENVEIKQEVVDMRYIPMFSDYSIVKKNFLNPFLDRVIF